MESKTKETPLIVVVGQTAAGKSAMAMRLAKKYEGEIVCADSRTVYRHMDIGTVKPTQKDRLMIPHHLLDIVDPGEDFNASAFKKAAEKDIGDISSRGKIPFLVGGSGLYTDSLIFDYDFSSKHDPKRRDELNRLTVAELRGIILSKNLPMPENTENKRHLARVIETGGLAPKNKKPRPNTLIIGLDVRKEVLAERIEKRTNQMIDEGLIGEARRLGEKYGWQREPMKSIGYREWPDYFSGKKTKDEVINQINASTRKFAKRQMTWFKRDKNIVWVKDLKEADKLVKDFLSRFDTIPS